MTTRAAAVSCLVCGSTDRPGSALDGILRRCGTCTFTWTRAELPPPDELYDSAYFQTEGYQDYFQPAARRFESRRRLRWLLSTGRPVSLVEAGSAGGYFVEAAGAAGIVAEGVEVSGAAVRFARERLGVRLRQGRFESATVAQPVAAVCAFHVLEHVEDPNEFLSAARRALLPGGRLALEVPNIASAAARRLGTGWPHIEPRYHRWHFTPESLTRLVTAHGFQVVRRDTVFSRFYWRPWARLTHARDLFIADWVASRRASVRHPTLGDALRLVARHTNGSRPV